MNHKLKSHTNQFRNENLNDESNNPNLRYIVFDNKNEYNYKSQKSQPNVEFNPNLDTTINKRRNSSNVSNRCKNIIIIK